jgi:protein TonB
MSVFQKRRATSMTRSVLASGGALLFGVALTVALFIILPILENIGKQDDKNDLTLTTVDAVEPPPPPPTVEQKPEEPPPADEKPPELTENAPPLDLSQLELALNPGAGEGMGGDFAVKLSVGQVASSMTAQDDIFALADLDQPPRATFQPAPQYPAQLKKRKIQGTVYVLFIVDKDGRVRDPKIQKSDNAELDIHAMNAVKKWRFEPGKVAGKPVQFRMRVPMTFAL